MSFQLCIRTLLSFPSILAPCFLQPFYVYFLVTLYRAHWLFTFPLRALGERLPFSYFFASFISLPLTTPYSHTSIAVDKVIRSAERAKSLQNGSVRWLRIFAFAHPDLTLSSAACSISRIRDMDRTDCIDNISRSRTNSRRQLRDSSPLQARKRWRTAVRRRGDQ